MESIQFSYTPGERIRSVRHQLLGGYPIVGVLILFLLVFSIVDGILFLAGGMIEGLESMYWIYAYCYISGIAWFAYAGYEVTDKFTGIRSLDFGDGKIVISVEGQSNSMTALRGFGLASPTLFVLNGVDNTVTIIPKRIFDSPSQFERFKRCGNELLENYKRRCAASQNKIENTAE